MYFSVSLLQQIVLVGLGVGSVMSLVFHLLVTEQSPLISRRAVHEKRSAMQVLRDKHLYQLAGVYMATRIFVNLTQVYIPLYLHSSLDMSAESLAIIPLVMFLASFTMSIVIKTINQQFGRKVCFIGFHLETQLVLLITLWML
jgi:hypothetical protein